MSTKVLLTEMISPTGVAALEQKAEVVYAPDPSVESALPLVADVSAIISRNTVIDERIFAKAPKLKAVASHGVGYDHIDIEAATRHGVCVVNTPGANAQSVAELTIALMLALGRKMVYADHALRVRHDFSVRNKCSGQDMREKTVLIIGMGAVGRAVAQICIAGFSMRVLGYSPHVTAEQMTAIGVEKVDDLDLALPLADYVTIHCPYTEDRYHMIHGERLAKMKPSAYLINCARGKLIDEQALYEALKNGTIAGAGLDVFDPEPPAADNPLFALENVIVTPHLGYNALDSFNRMSLWSVEDVLNVIQGDMEKVHLVNKEVLRDA